MHLISIPVPSVTTTANEYMFLMVLIILVRRGPVGEYLVEHQNWREQGDQEQQQRSQESDPQSGVAGGCGNILEGTTVLSSTWLSTGSMLVVRLTVLAPVPLVSRLIMCSRWFGLLIGDMCWRSPVMTIMPFRPGYAQRLM